FLVYMLSPLPRRSDWAYCFAHSPNRVSLPRYGSRVDLRIVLFEACSAFTCVTACTLALSPYFVTRLSEGFSHFVTSIAAPVASGWSVRRVGLAPPGKAPPYHGARHERSQRFTQLRTGEMPEGYSLPHMVMLVVKPPSFHDFFLPEHGWLR